MKKVDEHIENLIVLYYSGEADEQEKQELLAWVEEDAAHRQYFYDAGKLWRGTAPHDIDTEAEWHAFRERITRSEGQRLRVLRKRRMTVRLAAAAAVLVAVIFGATILSLMRPVTFATAGIPAEMVLPDSSRVYLNAGSVLKYPRRFREKVRRVALSGEAFFEVTHDASRSFEVEAAGALIRDLGTSFNVMAYDTASTVEVVVATGRVALSPRREPARSLILDPGMKGVYIPGKEKLVREENRDVNYLAWKTRRMVFDNELLTVIVQTLNKVYHTDIRIESRDLGSCRVTATFDRLPLEAVLHILSSTLGVEVRKEGEKIILTGEGCQ